MEYVCSPFVPLGVLFPARRGDPVTATVKLSYDVSELGWARPAAVPDALVEQDGAAYPRDLRGPKQACDVVIVGWATQEPGPVTFGAGGQTWSRASAREGAPIEGGASDAGFAPPDQRIPFPALPLELFFESQSRRLRAVVPAPRPAVGLVAFSAWHALRPLPIALDGVLIDPARALVTLTFRAIFVHDGDPERDLTLVVYPAADDQVPRVSAMTQWPVYKCPTATATLATAPSDARGGPRRGFADDEVTSTGVAIQSAPQSSPRRGFADDEVTSTSIAIPLQRADADLPFQRAQAPRFEVQEASHAPALPFATPATSPVPPTAAGATIVDDDELHDTDRPGPGEQETVEAPAIPAPPPAFAQPAPSPSPAIAPPARFAPLPTLAEPTPPPAIAPPARFAPLPTLAEPAPPPAIVPPALLAPPPMASPAPLPPPPVALAAPPAASPRRAPRSDELGEADVAQVRLDLRAFPDRRREILRERGLSEASWREHEQRFPERATRSPAEALSGALALLQGTGRRPPVSWRKG